MNRRDLTKHYTAEAPDGGCSLVGGCELVGEQTPRSFMQDGRIMKKGTRGIPMFYLLRRELEKQFEQVEEGSIYVIKKWRSDAQNFRKRFERIVFLAGLPRWERLFHHLRGSRSNELFS